MLPASAAYLPAIHGAHPPAPVRLADAVPAGPGVHAEAPAGAKRPGPHTSVHGAVALACVEYVPAAQRVHSARVPSGEYVPAGQFTQPTFSTAYIPALHGTHAARVVAPPPPPCAGVVVVDVPDGHGVQAILPAARL